MCTTGESTLNKCGSNPRAMRQRTCGEDTSLDSGSICLDYIHLTVVEDRLIQPCFGKATINEFAA